MRIGHSSAISRLTADHRPCTTFTTEVVNDAPWCGGEVTGRRPRGQISARPPDVWVAYGAIVDEKGTSAGCGCVLIDDLAGVAAARMAKASSASTETPATRRAAGGDGLGVFGLKHDGLVQLVAGLPAATLQDGLLRQRVHGLHRGVVVV